MVLEPSRRQFSDKPPEYKLKDVDAAERGQRIHALGWSLFAGVPLGAAVGALVGLPLVGIILGPCLAYVVVMAIVGTAGRGASQIYMPSGKTTPHRKEYSRAMALEVRGEHCEAVKAYEAEILDDPEEPEPYLRIARLQRDSLQDPRAAAQWFKRAQREAVLSPGQAIRTHRELAELFIHTLKEPFKAAPDLARLAETYPNTPDGRWAAVALVEMKAEMAEGLAAGAAEGASNRDTPAGAGDATRASPPPAPESPPEPPGYPTR